MNLLERIQPPWIYRYVFYRLSKISRRLGNNDPEFSTMLLMTITTLFQFFFILLAISFFWNENIWLLFFSGSSALKIIVFMLIFIVLNYLLFTYKGKWKRFEKEFEEYTSKDKKHGTIYLWSYLIISFGLFFVNLWMLTLNNPHYQ